MWQVCVVFYLAVAFSMSIATFPIRKTYSPSRTRLAPSLVASLLSGLMWAVALPVALIALLGEHAGRKR